MTSFENVDADSDPETGPPPDPSVTGNDGIASEGEEERIGYRRPPKAHRFKPGQSGNPKGRPRREVAGPMDVSEVLRKTVTITVKGKSRKVSGEEASIRALVVRALIRKELTAALEFVKLCQKHKIAAAPPSERRHGVMIIDTRRSP